MKKSSLLILVMLSLVGCGTPRQENKVTCSTTHNALYSALGQPEKCKNE